MEQLLKKIAFPILAVILSLLILISIIFGIITNTVGAIGGVIGNRQDNSAARYMGDLGNIPEWISADMVGAAIQQMFETGYPASVLLGQMILEGGVTGSALADPPNYNCLGLKSPSYLEVGTVTMWTEESWGEEYAAFSKFKNYLDCMRAWGHRFTMEPYVENVNNCARDPTTGYYQAYGFLEAIWKSGYATDTKYVDKVYTCMESYNLLRFDYMSQEDLDQLENTSSITGNGQFTHPCPGMTYQSSYFGEIREYEIGGHKGNDYAAPAGTPTYAAASGTVTIAGWSDTAGNWIVIDHGNGLVTKYMHHSKLCVSAGQTVQKGQKIGEVGNTGQSTGPHLHFQVEVNGVPVSPDQYL